MKEAKTNRKARREAQKPKVEWNCQHGAAMSEECCECEQLVQEMEVWLNLPLETVIDIPNVPQALIFYTR